MVNNSTKSQRKNKNSDKSVATKKSGSKKITNKEKAVFYEQGRVDMYPVDPYND